MTKAVNHVTTGIRSVLSLPWVYAFYQKMVFPRTVLVREYLKPEAGQRVLDIGCGTGNMLAHLPAMEYVGIDASEHYIQQARARYGDKGSFQQVSVEALTLPQTQYFDLALAVGVLHHISDSDAQRLFQLAKSALKPGGRLIAVEPCYGEEQSWLARWIISKDRGQNVKTKAGYVSLTSQAFDKVNIAIRHDLLRIPYTLAIIECYV